MKVLWKKPDLSTATPYRRSYIERVPDGDLPQQLETNLQITLKLLNGMPADKLTYRYAPGKWSIPMILQHMSDCERIFAYRILCIARGDTTPLPGFEEDDYARESGADEKKFSDILLEFEAVRKATILLLRSLTPASIGRKGTSNNSAVTVQELAYMLAGHELHHLQVIRERYLNKQ